MGPRTESAANSGSSSRVVDLTPYYGHLPCFCGLGPLRVTTNRYTYAPTYTPRGEMQNTWLSIALDGIDRLHKSAARRRTWARIAVIGTGNGLDVIGISRIAHPERIVASDIHPRALDAADENTTRYVDATCHVDLLESDLFADYPPDARFDFIYENLPNIPDGSDLFDGIRSASCYAPRSNADGRPCDRHLLTLHHEFLIQARSRLEPGGSVACVIGGRVPLRWIQSMFGDAGFRSSVVGFGLKIQSEADVVLPGYAAAEERHGSSFQYYHPLERCVAVARAMPLPGGVTDLADHARRCTLRLRPWRISATEALRRHRDGDPVCHTVYVLEGHPAA